LFTPFLAGAQHNQDDSAERLPIEQISSAHPIILTLASVVLAKYAKAEFSYRNISCIPNCLNVSTTLLQFQVTQYFQSRQHNQYATALGVCIMSYNSSKSLKIT
jgi:hypothetical protein